MSQIEFVMIDGTDCKVTACDLDFRHEPILDVEKSEEAGYYCYGPGLVTWTVKIKPEGILPVRLGECCLLAVPMGEWTYMGEAKYDRDELTPIGTLSVFRFTQEPRRLAA